MQKTTGDMRKRALLNQLANPYLNLLLLLLLGLLILLHWSVRSQLRELQTYNEGRVADTGRTLEIVGKYKQEIEKLKDRLKDKCPKDSSDSKKVNVNRASDKESSNGDVKISNVNLQALLNGPVKCEEPCMDHPLLIDYLKSAMDKPSGVEPDLKDPEGIKNQRGQTGQVNTILKFFNNKVKSDYISVNSFTFLCF